MRRVGGPFFNTFYPGRAPSFLPLLVPAFCVGGRPLLDARAFPDYSRRKGGFSGLETGSAWPVGGG